MTLIDENAPDMRDLGDAMTTAIKQFSKFKNAKVKNSDKVSKKIEEINQQRLQFREFTSESIKQSSRLSRYAEEVIIFAECCADDRFSRDDLIELLRLRLNDAKRNKEEVEVLQLKIKHIMEDLTDINDSFMNYVEDIKKDERLLNSETKKKLEEKEAIKGKFSVSSKANASVAVFGLVACCIAAPFSGGTSMIAPIAATCVDAGIFLATAGSSLALGTKFLENAEKSEIASLDKKLKSERDRLIDHIQSLRNDLTRIVNTCNRLSNFWENQIEAIKNLINKLQSFIDNQEGIRNTKMISVVLLKPWKNVNNECKEYNRLMLSLLDNDALLGVAVVIDLK